MTFLQSPISLQLKGKVVIVPIVSTANIGQLAVDLIITTFSLDRIAILDPHYCVPIAGAREDGRKGITTPLELYGHPDIDFVVIQQRSPVLKSLKADFVAALLDFIKTSGFGAALLLSGVDLSNRTDAQMMTSTYQIQPERTPNFAGSPLQKLSSLPIPTYTSPLRPEFEQSNHDHPTPFIPGGGLTRRILSSIPEGWQIPIACLLQFVLEGDNRADAGLFASVIAKILNKDISQWRQPSSWRAGLFGSPHDQTLYG